jgi:hypothetical protein
MSAYADSQRASGSLKDAQDHTECDAPNVGPYGCMAYRDRPARAVHYWNGRNYCAFHSPFEFGEYASQNVV